MLFQIMSRRQKGKPIFFKILVGLLLVAAALFERIFFDLGPNVELVTLTTFLAGAYLGFPYSFFVPLATLFISDLVLGNSLIFLFTFLLTIGVPCGLSSLFQSSKLAI